MSAGETALLSGLRAPLQILALQQEERQTRQKLGRIIAAIGAELIAVKEALDKLAGKTAWQRWLKSHVHYSMERAQNYMSVARFAEKNGSASVFFELDATMRYRLAARDLAVSLSYWTNYPVGREWVRG